ncbi:helix-turn-helix domain-containing protein [Thiothrix subterranea]|uniref:helix-turn-helix domain-containing protein n=1 Tax=Thiothrix subterranea TaxID=2735563 RepID=UPI00192C8AF1|nr:helix-turn-helix domain-containing protein [Thiothrix subterranea]QQZ30784.1 helix-turn-helix domain-containing protein [Thiothrix subterranea]
MKTIDFLDKAKEKLGISRDSDLAKAINCGTGKIANYRTGSRKPDVETCFRLAEILNVEPQAVISAVRAESEVDPEKQRFWMNYAKRYGVALSPFILAGTITLEIAGLSAPANSDLSIKSGINDKTILCIMRNSVRG